MTGYRDFMITSKPSLQALDDMVIHDFERQEVKELYPKDIFKRDRL
jgi:hypothetical protein